MAPSALAKLLNPVIDYLHLRRYTTRWTDRWTIIRVWVALWLCALSMIIRPVERVAGIAAFLPIVLGFIRFPSDPTIVFLSHSLLGGLATMAAWGWVVLAMKCSIATRDHNRDLATYARLNATIYQENPSPYPGQIEAQLSEYVFRGAFLQAGPSAVYAVFFFIGVYLVMLVRAINVRLFFIMVFSAIILSIYCTFGPLIPLWYATELGAVYLIPYGIYLACCTFASVFVAPQSVAHLTMERLRASSALITDAVSLTPGKLREISDEAADETIAGWDANREGFKTTTELTLFISAYLSKEISFGRASGRDVKRMFEMFRTLGGNLAGMSIFIRHTRCKNQVEKAKEEKPEPEDNATTGLPYASPSALKDLLAELAISTANHQNAIIGGMKALTDFFDRETYWNHGAWGLMTQPPPDTADLIAALGALKAASAETEALDNADRKAASTTVKKHSGDDSSASDDHGDLERIEKAPSYLREVWKIFIAVFATDLEGMLELALAIEQRPIRMWWPGKQNADDYDDHRPVPMALTKQFSTVFGGDTDLPLEEDNPDRIEGLDTDTTDGKDPESHQRTSSFKLYRAWRWFTASHESTFSLKVAVLAIALACPAWIPSNGTAEFYYRYKGIWALITGITAKGMFSGETTWGFIQRLIGVVVGALVGMVVWYISAGGGHGNPYGLAATLAVTLALIIPWRIWNPNFLLIITVTTTGTLVTGYSWIDRPDAPVLGIWPPGQGYPVFWKRVIVVLVGIVAAWIIDLFPRPKSARESIRKTYSLTTLALGSVAADLVSSLRTSPKDPAALKAFLECAYELRAIHGKLRITTARIGLARLEPSSRGVWQPERYIALQRLQYDAIDLLGVFAYACEQMSTETKTRLLSTPALQNARISALLNVFYATSSALGTGRALPAQLPGPKPDHVLATVDEELAIVMSKLQAGNTSQLVIVVGTILQLEKIASQLASETRGIFGSSMEFGS